MLMPAGVITALQAQALDPQRVNVFVDGEFMIGVSLNTIAKEKLYVGKVLSEDDHARLEQTENTDKAVHVAIRALEARPRSSAEIRERLRLKGFAPLVIDAALDRLLELGLVDDATFARFWVENRQACRPRGANALRDELRRKGIDRTVIDAVLDDTTLTGDEHEQAMTLGRAALRKYASAPDRASFTRRLGGYLQRRGFDVEIIWPIVDQLWDESRGNDE
jgi:regulatory protein